MKFFEKQKARFNSDDGFMGKTHAVSAIALYLTLAWMFPKSIFEYLDTNNIFVFIVSVFVMTGAAIMPDFDNTSSTAINSTGFIGKGISHFMRFTSSIIQNTVKTKYDKDTSNPHRAFWHTTISAFVIWLIVYITTSISIEIPVFGKDYTIGFIFALFWIFFSFLLCFAILFGKIFKKNNKSLTGSIINIAVSLIASIVVLFYIPSDINYNWIAFSMTIGYFLHILGDVCTVSGAPIFWPLKIRGKRWFNVRLPFSIHAGGDIEKVIILPMFICIGIFSFYKVLFTIIL